MKLRPLSGSCRRILCAAVLVSSIVWEGAPAASADARRNRVERARYSGPMRGHPDWFGVCVQPDNRGCVEFGVGPRDRKVFIRVQDDAAPADEETAPGPYFILRQDVDGTVVEREFCGTTGGYVDIVPNARITVFVYATTTVRHPDCRALATSGEVQASFRTVRT